MIDEANRVVILLLIISFCSGLVGCTNAGVDNTSCPLSPLYKVQRLCLSAFVEYKNLRAGEGVENSRGADK